jgi:pilin isopeptide linkage protein
MNRTVKTKGRIILCVTTILMLALISVILAPVAAYAANAPLKITVEQTVDTALPLTEAVFKYKLTPLDPSNPMPSGSTPEGYVFTITGNNSVEIGSLRYDRQDIYRYRLYQVIEAEKPGYTYDKRTYIIEVHVDETLNVVLVVINVDGTKAVSIKFENGYRVLPSDSKSMIDPPVKKMISGNPGYIATFEFKLTAMDVSYPMPAGSINGVKILRIMGSDQDEFGTWSYTKAGTYYYTVCEVNTGASGFIYDKTVYTITDTVKDENGQLVLLRSVKNNSNIPVTSLVFLNRFDADKPGPITGDDMNTALYYLMLILSGSAAIAALFYLITGKKRKKDSCIENR